MASKLDEVRSQLTDKVTEFAQEVARYSDESPPNGEQQAALEARRTEIRGLRSQIDQLDGFAQLQADSVAQAAWLKAPASTPPHAPEQSPAASGRLLTPRTTIGQRFVDDPEYKAWLARIAPNGQIPDSARGLNSPPLQFRGLRDLNPRGALLTGSSDTLAGAMIIADQYPEITEAGRRPLTIRDVITVGQTDSDVVEYVRITSETNNAAPVAEATATSGSSGVKPESAMALERVTAAVKTIAHWIPATKRALSDASQLRTLIDNFLRFGLDEELEDQIVTGSGSGENFTGILETSGTQAQAWDTDALTTTRKARTKVRTVGRRIPNAFILHPTDWQTIDLLEDNEGRYYFGGPREIGAPRLWGLPVVESEAVTQGTGLVGDFKTCVLWDREQASISVSDSHSDFFVRNMVAILAELRAAFGILKPNAIVEIDLTA